MPETPPYTLLRSRRRTLAVEITPTGAVLVRAPLHMGQARIETFLREHAAWVERARARVRMRTSARQTACAVPGGRLWLWGHAYAVHARAASGQPVWDGTGFYLSDEKGAREAAAFFQTETLRILPKEVETLAAAAHVPYARVAVGGARARWGSCSTARVLRFSWRLACVPPEAAVYVAAHELAHIREMNHSPAFWREVARIRPDFETGQQVLRNFEHSVDVSKI